MLILNDMFWLENCKSPRSCVRLKLLNTIMVVLFDKKNTLCVVRTEKSRIYIFLCYKKIF